jgi:hypothetical protein
MMVGVQNATIARNTIGSMTVAGVALAGGSSNINVRQNQIDDVDGSGIWIGGQSDVNQFRPALMSTGNAEARNIRVFNNVIRNVRDAIQCSNCTDSLVAHNLIRRAARDLLLLHQPYTELSSGGNTYEFIGAGGVRMINNAIELRDGATAFSAEGVELDLSPARSAATCGSARAACGCHRCRRTRSTASTTRSRATPTPVGCARAPAAVPLAQARPCPRSTGRSRAFAAVRRHRSGRASQTRTADRAARFGRRRPRLKG